MRAEAQPAGPVSSLWARAPECACCAPPERCKVPATLPGSPSTQRRHSTPCAYPVRRPQSQHQPDQPESTLPTCPGFSAALSPRAAQRLEEAVTKPVATAQAWLLTVGRAECGQALANSIFVSNTDASVEQGHLPSDASDRRGCHAVATSCASDGLGGARCDAEGGRCLVEPFTQQAARFEVLGHRDMVHRQKCDALWAKLYDRGQRARPSQAQHHVAGYQVPGGGSRPLRMPALAQESPWGSTTGRPALRVRCTSCG